MAELQTNKYFIAGLLAILAVIYIAALVFFAPLGYYGVKTTLEGNTDPTKKAVIYVDSMRAAEGDMFMSFITPRKYVITMKHEGYETITKTIFVQRFSVRNKPIDTFTLKKLYSYDVRSDPPGATIYLEGSPVMDESKQPKKTPVTLRDLEAGPHTIKLVLDGYPPIGYTINTAKDPSTINFSFKEGMSVLFQTEPKGAIIFIDGKEMGKTPCRIDGLSAKEYLIETKLEGYRPVKRFVDIGIAGNNLNLKLDKMFVVPVITDPPGVDVKLDGVLIGKTPIISYCTSGSHTYMIGVKEVKLEAKENKTIYEVFDNAKKDFILVSEDGQISKVNGKIGAFECELAFGKYKVFSPMEGGRMYLGTINWQGKPVKMPEPEIVKKATIQAYESTSDIWLIIDKSMKNKDLEEKEEIGNGLVELDWNMLLEKAGDRAFYTFEIGAGDLKVEFDISKAEIFAGLKFVVEPRK